MSMIDVDSPDDPRVAGYRDLKDRDLRLRRGLFVVEGRGTLRCLLEQSPFRPLSILLGEPAYRALADELASLAPGVPVYRAPAEVLRSLAGFAIHRGCLALVERLPDTDLDGLLDAVPAGGSRLLVMEGLTNHDNVGGLFRNALAFGVDAAVLCPRCCDPLYRKAIRTSLGGSLCVPFARAEKWPHALARLRDRGYRIVALDPGGDADLAGESARAAERLAVVVGTEGQGLSDAVRAQADACVRIEMAPGVDSINVATAAAIALHQLRRPAGHAGAR